ncbi:MAG: hypothetical protein MI723_17730, partial [Caulobacterales bacterium]|nr:hypothetical protein [Caulobacterales bacterium]
MLILLWQMWAAAICFFLLGLWARGYVQPRGLDASAQTSMELAAARTRLQRCDAERIRLNARVAEIEPKLASAEEKLETAGERIAKLQAAAKASGAAVPPDMDALTKRVTEMERELAAARELAAEARVARDLRRQLEKARGEIAALTGETAAPAPAEE